MSYSVRTLAEDDWETLETLLVAGGAADAWLLHALDTAGIDGFLGAYQDGVLSGAVLVRGGALCASALTRDAAVPVLRDAVRRRGPWFSIVGPERPCTALARGLLAGRKAHVDRRQVFMVVRDASRLQGGEPGLRRATTSDLDALVPLVAQYRREDGLARPGEERTRWVAAHTAERVDQGLVYVLEAAGRIVFTGAFNFRGRRGCGLGGIFTVPSARGGGIGSRATAELCRRGLREGPVVTLHVDAANAAAQRCYERAGLETLGSYRLTFR